METKIIKINETETVTVSEIEKIKQGARILQAGGLVAFPTETVYGLGADALNETAALRIYGAKGRPSDNPLIVHIADVKAVEDLAEDVSDKAYALMEAFWPGPLTIILNKKKIVPKGTTGGLDTVAIRMPSHPVALALIKEAGVYVAAPSANLSGRPSPTYAEHVIEDLSGRIDMIIDGGPVGIGIESTIVDLTGEIPMILRPGYITKKMLETIVGEVRVDPGIIGVESTVRPKAPGMKYTHYAPKGILTIVEGQDGKKVIDTINTLVKEKQAQGYCVGVMAPFETADAYSGDYVLTVGSKQDGLTVSARLYATLRDFDSKQVEYIYSEAFVNDDFGSAIMNRLLKAAGHRVLHV